ncbi:acyl-CoA dehydrogenase family protein [Microvirga guangxiensis]|uniref:Acyl-CoA dehydrogenase, N-terminal domain n=1 Tax=Microvirga guangxiensis TaxID=549386 RepID=A0A1G5KMQ8_9HYPH|nr:acyl-CoA dehydrogenase family protein [Microvirga guangxiensis]SCZ01229.1 Acyl-CoA dehydrogenase, N-terminal domain [Microvirga guangxiensis]
MSALLTEKELAFREEVRAFLASELPDDISGWILSGELARREDTIAWARILHRRGWGGYTWPRKHSGPGFTPIQRYLFEDECAVAGAPEIVPFGLKMVAPVIMEFGSHWQREHFLPRIARLDDWWCQGYSEPGAGSDLASLRTRARRDGDFYIVDGQKTWTTEAHEADWIFCLVRTSTEARKQDGISFLLIDLKSPGITIRPIITFDGRHEINEVWFENVRVPIQNLVGEEGRGWTYAKYLLVHERLNFGGMGFCKREIGRLKRLAQGVRRNGGPVISDPAFRARLASLEMRLAALDMTNLRFLRAAERGETSELHPPYLKILSSHLQQDIAELQVRALGSFAMPTASSEFRNETVEDPEFAHVSPRYCNLRKTTIYAGSNEIQREIAAKHLLG